MDDPAKRLAFAHQRCPICGNPAGLLSCGHWVLSNDFEREAAALFDGMELRRAQNSDEYRKRVLIALAKAYYIGRGSVLNRTSSMSE